MLAKSALLTETTPTYDAAPLSLLGVEIDRASMDDVVAHVLRELGEGRGGTVFSVNLDTLRQAAETSDVRALLRSGSLLIPDGMPLVWASRVARRPITERVPGSTLVPTLATAAAKRSFSVFLLGGNEGAADAAAIALRAKAPSLLVAGVECPPFGFESDPEKKAALLDRVVASKPDLVFVGLGFPKQERLIQELRSELPEAWFVSCGITFSFLAGEIKRAPQWVQRVGFEWFHRFVQEPRRLFRRYFVHDIPFLFTLLRAASRQARSTDRGGDTR